MSQQLISLFKQPVRKPFINLNRDTNSNWEKDREKIIDFNKELVAHREIPKWKLESTEEALLSEVKPYAPRIIMDVLKREEFEYPATHSLKELDDVVSINFNWTMEYYETVFKKGRGFNKYWYTDEETKRTVEVLMFESVYDGEEEQYKGRNWGMVVVRTISDEYVMDVSGALNRELRV